VHDQRFPGEGANIDVPASCEAVAVGHGHDERVGPQRPQPQCRFVKGWTEQCDIEVA
jgi:hypothetical protein